MKVIHTTFHVCVLRKCYTDETNVILWEDVSNGPKKDTIDEPVEIFTRKQKKLRREQTDLVMVKLKHTWGQSLTWETESLMKDNYPHLYVVKVIPRTESF